MTEPSVIEIDGLYYFVSGAKSVHELGDFGEGRYARALSEEEIEELPFSFLFTGIAEVFQDSYFSIQFVQSHI